MIVSKINLMGIGPNNSPITKGSREASNVN